MPTLRGGELVSVWILTLAPRPVLVSDVRKLRLGGRRHVVRRLGEVLEALSLARRAMNREKRKQKQSDALTPLARTMQSHVLSVTDGSARQARVWQGAALEVLREMQGVDAHAEVRRVQRKTPWIITHTHDKRIAHATSYFWFLVFHNFMDVNVNSTSYFLC